MHPRGPWRQSSSRCSLYSRCCRCWPTPVNRLASAPCVHFSSLCCTLYSVLYPGILFVLYFITKTLYLYCIWILFYALLNRFVLFFTFSCSLLPNNLLLKNLVWWIHLWMPFDSLELEMNQDHSRILMTFLVHIQTHVLTMCVHPPPWSKYVLCRVQSEDIQ